MIPSTLEYSITHRLSEDGRTLTSTVCATGIETFSIVMRWVTPADAQAGYDEAVANVERSAPKLISNLRRQTRNPRGGAAPLLGRAIQHLLGHRSPGHRVEIPEPRRGVV